MPSIPLHFLALVALTVAPQDLVLPKRSSTPAQRLAPEAGGKDPRGARERERRGNVAPYLECTICYERNYTAPREPSIDGFQSAHCKVCQKVTRHRDTARKEGSASKPDALALPTSAAQPNDGTTGKAEVAPDAPPLGAAPAALALALAGEGGGPAAGLVFDEVAQLSRPEPAKVEQAVLSLIALGEAGRNAARARLFSDHGPTLVVVVRTLLEGGAAGDRDAVVRRLQGPLPGGHESALLAAVVTADPVAASPELFVSLLDHRQTGMRQAAQIQLKQRLDAELVPLLASAMESRRSDTRLRAVDLLASLRSDAALDVLLGHVADPTAAVAVSVVEALAGAPEERVVDELLAVAFHETWILRRQAYAVLALVEREDARLEPILDATHVQLLLGGLGGKDPFVTGVCAAALAGIGFRAPGRAEWLDRDVPDRLVWAISGHEFHNDYSALKRVVARRLGLISGEHFAGDGPAWVDWWFEARESFRARRARIELAPGEETALALSFRRGGANPLACLLIGPDARLDAELTLSGETLLLDATQCAEVALLLEREGVLGPDRLPGARGSRGGAERTLEVLFDGRGKLFRFGERVSEPWFERVAAMTESLFRQNRWQRYVVQPVAEGGADAEGAAGDASAVADARAAEAAFWAEPHDELERALRLEALVLDWLERQPVGQRDMGVTELVALWRDEPQLRNGDDMPRLVGLLEDERFTAERARALFDLALQAAEQRAARAAQSEAAALAVFSSTVAVPDGDPASASQPHTETVEVLEPRIDTIDALELVRVLDGFGSDAADELVRTYRLAGRDFARAMSEDERPLMRGIAAATLAESADDADAALLLRLFEDPSPAVEQAAVLAAGRHGVEVARTELLLRARVADPEVRVAALHAIGDLGGEFVFEALLLALTDDQPEVREAAAEGLAKLVDSRSVPYFVRLLAEDRDSAAYAAARDGLASLGDESLDDLLRILHSPGHPARREVALLLARRGRAEAVSALLRELSTAEDDPRVAWELAVLTCVDLEGRADPAQAWWAWWDSVVHDDALSWFVAALQRLSLDPPPASSFRAEDTRPAARYLLGVLGRPEAWLVERSRRELERLLGRPVPELPSGEAERAAWIDAARGWVEERGAR